jgi:transaldolase
MPKNPCHALAQAGTAVWLDQLSRSLLLEGRLESLISEAALSGVTSNPAIFHKAMTSGAAYDAQIASLAPRGLSAEELYEELAVLDIRMACDTLRPVWEETRGADGFVSLEVSPHLARDTAGTLAAARRLHGRVDRPNLLIKVPGTTEGLPAVEALLAEGVGVNVTLLFAVEVYEETARAYLRAMARRAASNLPVDVPSVASFFVSRMDTLVDSLLEEKAARAAGAAARDEILGLRGQAAVANAKLAYRSFQGIFSGPEWSKLEGAGARAQRPLWASTSTKNPAYRDVIYVEPLIGEQTVNTMPMETVEAFLDHGVVRPGSVEEEVDAAERLLARLAEAGVSAAAVTRQLLDEGIVKFVQPYDALLRALEGKRAG